MNELLKLIINLVEKQTKGNPILKIVVYSILMLCLILNLSSLIMHFSK